jgi:hypothetical protein
MNIKRKTILIVSIISVIILLWLTIFQRSGKNEKDVFVPVKKGLFEITVFTTGELEAKNSTDIQGPTGIRQLGIWQIKISDLVAEGTVVKKGEYVGALDKTEIAGKIREAESELQKIESQFTQNKLDTTLQLRQARDEIINLGFTLKEKDIVLEQSAFEPPATIRQAKLDLERSARALDQAIKNYKIKESQSIAKMQEITASLSITQSKMQQLVDVMQQFTINAPEDGMVIYQREWNGKRKTVGSTIGAWDPTVATLPDLSVMLSKTYVNEVDIRKLKLNQKVDVNLDAYPEKKLTGKIVSIANVGEQNPKSDAKVFEVQIQISEKDTSLRPAMTTGNNIIIGKIPNSIYVPLECIHNDGDSLSYVYLKDGLSFIKKEVKTGEANEDNIVIKEGLTEENMVYLSIPENNKDLEIEKLPIKKPIAKK